MKFDCRRDLHSGPQETLPSAICDSCGDGIVDDGNEACDDFNTANGDGCSNSCTVETGYVCNLDKYGKSVCYVHCGDGILNTTLGEVCDDGNASNGDGCKSDCTVESNWQCTSVVGAQTVCTGVCGDGKMMPGEICDDGNTSDFDMCLSDCSGPVNGWTCSGGNTNNPVTCTEICADTFITASETCDDGILNIDDGCS